MAGIKGGYTSASVPMSDVLLNGGLNTSGSGLALKDNESSDLQNIDFSKFGSIIKRNGYTNLNAATLGAALSSDGLWWYEYDSAGTIVRFAINVCNGVLYKMDDLDGTWDDITGALTITPTNHCDFDNFLNEVYVTNGENAPFKWTGTGNGSAMTVPTGLTKAKYVKQFENYLFLANCLVSGTSHKTRIYWSAIKDTSTWSSTAFLEIAKNDGQQIMGIRPLGDRLVVYKERCIYNIMFTGDASIPFVYKKSNSPVGCAAPFSIQEVDNGHVFASYDGLYFYDGLNSYKISDKINETFNAINAASLYKAVSANYKIKNRYMITVPSGSSVSNNRVIVWDYYSNAFSLYSGITASAMTIFYVDGAAERPYFCDYIGFTNRLDIGTSDNPAGVATAIDAYYWTNWKAYGDIVDKKGVSQANLFYQVADTTLNVSWAYNFSNNEDYTKTVDLFTTDGAVWDAAVWDVDMWCQSGGGISRIDTPLGRGQVVRFKFSNSTLNETFQIDGFGTMAHLETNV